MNGFKQFLVEETAKVKEWVFHKNTHIPISRKMIERIEGAKDPATNLPCTFMIDVKCATKEIKIK